MAEIEGRRLDVLLELVEVLGAGRAPGQHLGRARLAEALEGAMAHALVGRQVGFLELVDAAAMGGAADHVEVELQRVEDVHHVQHDVRRAQHVAARVEQHVGGAPLGRRHDALQGLRRQLHAGEQPHRLRHVAEAVGGIGRALGARPGRFQRLHLGDGHPLADVDLLGAGGAAARAAVAGVQPLLQGRRPAPRRASAPAARRRGPSRPPTSMPISRAVGQTSKHLPQPVQRSAASAARTSNRSAYALTLISLGGVGRAV